MTVLSQALLSFVSSHLMSFSFLSARHNLNILKVSNLFWTAKVIIYFKLFKVFLTSSFTTGSMSSSINSLSRVLASSVLPNSI